MVKSVINRSASGIAVKQSFFCRANESISLAVLSVECCSQWLMVKGLSISWSSQTDQCIKKLRNTIFFPFLSVSCDTFPSAFATWIVVPALISRVDKTQTTWVTAEKDPELPHQCFCRGWSVTFWPSPSASCSVLKHFWVFHGFCEGWDPGAAQGWRVQVRVLTLPWGGTVTGSAGRRCVRGPCLSEKCFLHRNYWN